MKIYNYVKNVIKKYPIIIAGLIIYLYYLFTSINFFQNFKLKTTFLDYILQFDSLIFLWLVLVLYIQIQKLRKDQKDELSKRFAIEKQFEIQQIHTKIINDITTLLQDNVNNPLAVISLTTREIRKKFEKDPEIIRWLDRIESSMQRIHNTIRDIQLYQTQKMVEESNQKLTDLK